ncbi:hypothetical protein FS837_011772 [Tulasnella sp. UAMH 9824]|nr:hypothetical protein FS837_011772 [Tulasnella sp. UAMH 9824]
MSGRSIFLSERPESDARIRVPSRPEDLNHLRPGDIVQSWEPWFVWSDQCEKFDAWNEWRRIGDPLADDALAALFPSTLATSIHGIDLLEALQSKASSDTESPCHPNSSPIHEYLDATLAEPPKGINATESEIHLAQAFFAANAVPITLSLLYFSLGGGFASSRISRILRSTSYIIPSNGAAEFTTDAGKERTVMRLLETLQFVIDVMGGSLPPALTDLNADKSKIDMSKWRGPTCLAPGTGEGWKSTLRVRLLHAVARRRVQQQAQNNTTEHGNPHLSLRYVQSIDGVPLNQEDMAYTLSAFAFGPLHCLPKLGFSFTRAEADATIAMWRHVGFYLGIDPTILVKHFRDWETAETFGAMCGQMLDLELHETLEAARDAGVEPPPPSTIALINALGNHVDAARPVAERFALTRYLLGNRASDLLSIPAMPRFTYTKLRLSLFTATLPTHFGHVYATLAPQLGSSWERRRGELVLEALGRMTRYKLGMRRTTFRARNVEGELEDTVKEAESVTRNKEDVARFMKRWRAIWWEMGGVLMAWAVMVGVLGWKLYY